jgi:nitrogen regulatory protein P-II 1
MKFIIAIIQKQNLEAVFKELEAVEVNLMTVSGITGVRNQKNATEVSRSKDNENRCFNKVRLDITINEDFVEPTIHAIIKGAHIDGASEGRIFVD